MHIGRANEITMATEAALATRPSSAFRLMTMPAAGTPAAGASFGAGRARDAGLFRFMGEVVDVFAVFPLRHAAIVAPATVAVAHAMRIADEERSTCRSTQKSMTLRVALCRRSRTRRSARRQHFIFRALQLLPAPGVLLAAALLFGELAELPASLPLEGTDAAPGDDERLARVGRHGGEVDFSEVNRRLDVAGSLASA